MCSRDLSRNPGGRGLSQPVEVIRDRWGISHIYAQSEDDLFMAQGYLAAKDRLFQFEIWRRRATGTVAVGRVLVEYGSVPRELQLHLRVAHRTSRACA